MASRLAFACTTLLAVAVAIGGAVAVHGQSATPAQPQLGSRTVTLLEVDGLRFKDLNKNGRLDAYGTGASRSTHAWTTWCRR
jgi:beta-glucosidase